MLSNIYMNKLNKITNINKEENAIIQESEDIKEYLELRIYLVVDRIFEEVLAKQNLMKNIISQLGVCAGTGMDITQRISNILLPNNNMEEIHQMRENLRKITQESENEIQNLQLINKTENIIISASDDASLIFWNVNKNTECTQIHQHSAGYIPYINLLQISPTKFAVTNGVRLTIYDINTYSPIFTLKSHTMFITSMCAMSTTTNNMYVCIYLYIYIYI